MKDCTNCANAIYDEAFGDKRCKVYNHSTHDADRYVDCQAHVDKEGSNDK